MELNDAKQILLISNEERKKVQDYIGFRQAKVNLLLDLEPYTVASREKDGLELFSSCDELFENIDVFTNVYGVMIKSEASLDDEVFFKYTTEDECKFFSGITKKIITVSKKNQDEFENNIDLENGTNTLIRYKTNGNIPHIRVSDYVEDENRQDEYLLPPFLFVKKFEFEKSIDGIKCYDAVLNKTNKINDVQSNDRKQELEAYIRENFDGFKEFVSYAKRTGKVVFDESYKKAYKFKEVVSEYIGVLCREKEEKVFSAKEVLDSEQERYNLELAERLEANKKRSMIRGMQNRIATSSDKAQSFFDKLDKLDDLIKAENEYVYYAKRLKIPYSRRLNVQDIKNRITAIKDAVQEMVKNVSRAIVHDEMTENEAREVVVPIQEDLRIVESLQLDVTGIEYLPSIFGQQMDLSIKEQIDRRAFDVIKALRIQKYRDDLRLLPEKPSFIDRITGKAKIIEEQRENLRLKIELEGLKKYEPKRTYSARETIADMDAEAKMLGITNMEMADFRAAIKTVFEIDEEDVRGLVEERISKTRNLPTKFDPRRVSNRAQSEYLSEVNKYLRESIKQERAKNQKQLRAQSSQATEDVVNGRKNFISDIEMYRKVNGMLLAIKEKTVEKIKGRKMSEDTRNTNEENDKDSGPYFVQVTDEEYIV